MKLYPIKLSWIWDTIKKGYITFIKASDIKCLDLILPTLSIKELNISE